MNYIDILERKLYNVDSKLCNLIDDYKILNDKIKLSDYMLQFLRTFVEHVAARIYADDYPEKEVVLSGKDRMAQYSNHLKDKSDYTYIKELFDSLQKTVSHYVPEGDGAQRLMLMYLTDLKRIKVYMQDRFGLMLLHNLEEYPEESNKELNMYYLEIYEKIKSVSMLENVEHTNNRYYVINKNVVIIEDKVLFEITLSYAQENVTKFDRFIVYSLYDVKNNYSIQADFKSTSINMNNRNMPIKILLNWSVSIRPCEIRKIVKLCGNNIEVRSGDSYYISLMGFLSKTGNTLLDIVISDEFEGLINDLQLYKKTELESTLKQMRKIILEHAPGHNILRYLLSYLKNDVIRDQIGDFSNPNLSELYIVNYSIPFDIMPFSTNLRNHVISKRRLYKCLDIDDIDHQMVANTANDAAYHNVLYTEISDEESENYHYLASTFNGKLHKSERQQDRRILFYKKYMYVKQYFDSTKQVIKKLQSYAGGGINDYISLANNWLNIHGQLDDNYKQSIISNIFSYSRVGLVYGAAGTGKTRVIEYVAGIYSGKRILLLANTNAAKNNLSRRVANYTECTTIYEYTHRNLIKKYNLVIVDECSTVSNDDILKILNHNNADAYLFVGDIYQIESIKFGNWFNYARYFIDKKSVYELKNPYRAKDNHEILEIWKCVRNFDNNMFEKMLNQGYIEPLNETIFEHRSIDEIILCLGYNGVYGINNINQYLQIKNPSPAVTWGEWIYKVGDPILFNETRRFDNILYNNLKGKIVDISKEENEIIFKLLVEKKFSENDALIGRFKLIDVNDEEQSLIEINVNKRVERDDDINDDLSIVPFQVAYCVSIHKAQGLEYESVKVVISEDVDERISHNIFYTAITRTKKLLKIYLSGNSQVKLAEEFKKSSEGLKQAQIFAGHAKLKLKNALEN